MKIISIRACICRKGSKFNWAAMREARDDARDAARARYWNVSARALQQNDWLRITYLRSRTRSRREQRQGSWWEPLLEGWRRTSERHRCSQLQMWLRSNSAGTIRTEVEPAQRGRASINASLLEADAPRTPFISAPSTPSAEMGNIHELHTASTVRYTRTWSFRLHKHWLLHIWNSGPPIEGMFWGEKTILPYTRFISYQPMIYCPIFRV